MTIAYLNGEFLPLDEVRISPLDRGFLFADGVYEVIPAYAGRLFRAASHVQRLQRSLAGIRIVDSIGRAGWHGLFESMVERNGGGDQAVYLQVTRGVAPRDHAFPQGVPATVFAMTRKVAPAPAARGMSAVTRPDIRWGRCDIKSVSLLPNVLMREEARDASASEAILIRDGLVTEGTATNVFVVQGDVLRTPPKSAHILGGVTRELVIELARSAGIDCREQPLDQARLRSAGEVWLSSSTKEVAAVIELDGAPVGGGVPGPVWQRMHALFQDFKERLMRGEVG